MIRRYRYVHAQALAKNGEVGLGVNNTFEGVLGKSMDCR